MKTMIRNLAFKIEFWKAKRTLAMSHNPFAYPVLIHLEFNKDAIKDKFMRGSSMTDIIDNYKENVVKTAQRRAAKTTRRQNLPFEEKAAFYNRYEDFCNYHRDKKAIEVAEKHRNFLRRVK